MGASRNKGNRLEREVARVLRDADGVDPALEGIETSAGRVGPFYHMQVDVITRRLAIECKNRQSIGCYLWEWLPKFPGKTPVLVVKRNGRKPLVVLDMEDFACLLRSEET